MTKLQKALKEIDEVLSSPSIVTPEEIAKYQEDVEAYYNESYELTYETC